MGKTSDAIDKAEKKLKAVEKESSSLHDAERKVGGNVQMHRDFAVAGAETLAQYLTVKKDEGALKGSEKLSDLDDDNVDDFLKGLDEACDNLAGAVDAWFDLKEGDVAAYIADLDEVDGLVATAQSALDRKIRKKLLKSSDFKKRMKAFDASLAAAGESIAGQRSDLKERFQDVANRKLAPSLRVSENDTVDDAIDNGGRSMAVEIDNMNKALALGVYAPKQKRQQHLKSALKSLSDLSDEGDELEQAGE